MKSVAEGASGVVSFFLVKVLALQYLSLLTLVACAVWVFTAVRLKGHYVRALEVAIEKHGLDTEELTLDAHDSAIVAVIDRALRSDDEIQRLFALELIDRMPPDPGCSRSGNSSPAVRMKCDGEFCLLRQTTRRFSRTKLSQVRSASEVTSPALLSSWPGNAGLHSVLPQLQTLSEGSRSPASGCRGCRHLSLERRTRGGSPRGPERNARAEQRCRTGAGAGTVWIRNPPSFRVRNSSVFWRASRRRFVRPPWPSRPGRRDEALLPAIISSLAHSPAPRSWRARFSTSLRRPG